MNYPDLLKKVSLPNFLEFDDLLRLAGTKYHNYNKEQDSLQAITDLGFCCTLYGKLHSTGQRGKMAQYVEN